MTKQALPPVSIPRLNREAVLLQGLYKAYLSDRQFLSGTEGARVIAFLDSHEVKAYIDPDAPGSLTGFNMHVETAFGEERRRTVVGLRHDQILNGLLFDPSRNCAILPSHAEEMDREVAFRFNRWVDTTFDLIENAKDEIQRHRRKAQQIFLLEERRALGPMIVRFFQTHAPALTAVLSDNLSTPHGRLEAVLDNSRITLFEEIRWTDFGVKQHDADRLRTLKPTPAQLEDMQQKLRSFEYRKNTVEANHVDAAALAYMELLRRELDHSGYSHLRVVLVSRARTLLRAATDLATRHGGELLVRHPRMLALAGTDADELDKATELALGTALDVWQGQVRNHPKVEADEEDPEKSPLKKPAEAFLDTWDTFEGSRLAVEARWRRQDAQTNASSTDEGELAERLLNLFCNVDAEAILNRTLINRFNKFSNASSRFLLDAGQLRLPARLTKLAAGGRVCITPMFMGIVGPMVVGAVGPIQVADWDGSPDSGTDLTLEEIASKLRSEAERPLIWALALACAGRWKQAAIFARSAQQLADLEGDGDTADEGRLLRAEIRRLGATAPLAADRDDDDKSPEVRYQRSLKDLSLVRSINAARRLREEAAQLLEAALAGAPVPDLADKLHGCFVKLDTAIDAADDEESKARFIALMLMIQLYDERMSGGRSALRPEDLIRAAARHKELSEVFKAVEKQGHIDTMPHRARAMEVIGHVLPGAEAAEGISRPGANRPRPANVPDTLRRDLPDLLMGLEASHDNIAAFLKKEVENIQEGLRPLHSPELLLAPVSTPQSAVALLNQHNPDISAMIAEPLQRLEAAGRSMLSNGPTSEHGRTVDQSIAKLEAAVTSGRQQRIDGHQMFYLRVALLYARLLDATLEPTYAQKQRFRKLIGEYEELRDDYPDATLPHVRVAYLAEKLDLSDRERDAFAAAMKLVDADKYYPPEGGRPHWLQSFVRRRYASIILKDIADVTRKWSGEPASPEALVQAEALAKACSLLLEAERRGEAPGGEAADIERRRRINNLVYYGSRLIERTGSEDAFNKLSPGVPLAAFVSRLVPADIKDVDDIDVVHTVGCYYAAVANVTKMKRAATAKTKEARQAAGHIVWLASTGKTMAPELIEEVRGWLEGGRRAEPIPAPSPAPA